MAPVPSPPGIELVGGRLHGRVEERLLALRVESPGAHASAPIRWEASWR